MGDGTTMTTFHLNQRNMINHGWPMWSSRTDNEGRGEVKTFNQTFSQIVLPLWPFFKVKKETVKAANWTGLNTSADSLRVDCRNPDSPNLSNRFPQVASAGCSNADSHATGSGKQRPSVALVAIVKVHLCVLLNNPCTSKIRAKYDLCCHHKKQKKQQKKLAFITSVATPEHLLGKLTHFSKFSLVVRSFVISWKLSPSYTDVASWDAHTDRLAAPKRNAESLWRQPGLRHHRGDYWWEDGVRSACPHPHLSSVQSI